MTRRIYVASSWRNERQPEVVRTLREAGHEVYDFRHHEDDSLGFSWKDIDGDQAFGWVASQTKKNLDHSIANNTFDVDWQAMKWAEIFVLVTPCGRSAHLEAGWAVGAGKPTAILLCDNQEPELMWKMVDFLALDLDQVIEWLSRKYVQGINSGRSFLLEPNTERPGENPNPEGQVQGE